MNKRIRKVTFAVMAFVMLLQQFITLPFGAMAESLNESNELAVESMEFQDESGEKVDSVETDENLSLTVRWNLSENERDQSTTIGLPDEVTAEDSGENDLVNNNEKTVGTYSTTPKKITLQSSEEQATEGELSVPVHVSSEEVGDQNLNFTVNGEIRTVALTFVETEIEEIEAEEIDGSEEAEEGTEVVAEITPEENNSNESDIVTNSDSVEVFAEIEENIFTFSSLTHNGEEIEEGSIIDITDGTAVELVFAWNTEGLSVQSGDTASMQLPETFDQTTTPDAPIVTSGITVGTYSIQNGELIFVFNDNIEDGDVSEGIVGLNLDFNLQEFEENIEQVIEFNDSANTTLNVLARPTGEISGITKEGHPDREQNAREITWSIDVMNTNDEPISDANLADVLPDGLGEPRDFVINELSVGLSGDKQVGSEVSIESQVDENEFSVEFENIAPFTGYRVEYTTTIEDYTINSFTNNTTFSYEDTNLPADATVDGLERSNPIEKNGEYNWSTHQVDWTIIVNESGGEIDEAIVYDTLPEEQSLVEGSIEVYRYDSNWENRESVSIDEDDFSINLGQVTSEEIYEIEFSTNIDWTLVNDGEYQYHNQFTNETELRDGEITVGEYDATVDHWRDNLLEKSGESNVDYDNNTLTWTVEVNNAKHPLNNVVVDDVIPEGLSISQDDIEITGEDGELYESDRVVTGQNVQINLGNIGTETITIEYTTTITDFTIDDFDNAATLEGDGIGVETPEDNAVINPPANSFAKDFAGIDYSERTMEWNLTVNPIREGITELTIVDTFPNKGMILLPNTLVVEVGGEEVTEGITLTPNEEEGEEGYHKGFTIVFDNSLLSLNAEMEITYQTSYDPQFEVGEHTLDPHVDIDQEHSEELVYVNHAQFRGNTEHENDFDTGRYGETTVREDSWNSGYKEGQLVHEDDDGDLINGWQSGSDRMIAWQLYTNYMQQNLGGNVVITDTLQYAGAIDEDSIRISEYNVSPDGTTTITNDVTNSLDFTLDVDGDEFTLTFNQVVDERYVVEFLTTVPDLSAEGYTNGATVIVDGTDYPYTGTVDYENYDNFLDKSAIGQEGNDIYIGEEINWEVQVNDSLSVIDNAVVRDVMSDGLEYVQGTLEVTTGSGNTLSEGLDYILTTTETAENETILTIELNDTLSESLTLNYTTVVTAEDEDTVNNTVALNGDNIDNVTVTSEELTAEQFSWVSGEFNENRGALQIVKTDSETGEPIGNNPATFALYYELNGERVLFADGIETEGNGEAVIGNLPLRTYYIQEVEAPTGYVIDEEEQEIEVTDPYGTDENVYETEFTNTKMKTDISVTKEWEDENNQDGERSESVDVQLLADGEDAGDAETLSEDNEWTYTWEDLDEYQSNGEIIDYSVEEVVVPEGYDSTVTDEDDGTFTITNTYTPETLEIAVSKEWEDEDDQDGVRPNNVEVNLLNGSEVVTEAVLNEGNDWQYTFTDLAMYSNGEEINYSVTEDAVLHYSTDIVTTETDEGLNSVVTNTYTPEETSATVTKLWNDGENQDGNRPQTVTVQLLADGEPHGNEVNLTAGDWSYTWSGLDLNSEGTAIDYTVEEIEEPEDYEVSVNNDNHGNLTITNSYEPEETEISVFKYWDDQENQDGVRPSNITANLLSDNGEIVTSVILDAENNWEHTFTDLPMYANGEEIDYSVTENSVPDYSTSINGAEDGFIITNSYTPGETSVTVTKGWDDGNNQDDNRPESIEVQLTANGEDQDDPVILTAFNDWTHTWDELDEMSDGEAINYSVEEVNTPDRYDESINDNDHGNIVVTNSYTPETTEVPVSKVWDDQDNQDGVRPNNVYVNLIADGGEVVSRAVLDDENEWGYTFTDLPQFDDGEEISYRVTENSVSEYSTSIAQNDEEEFIVTNSYTPDETSVTVTKGWNDANNQDGHRPDSIDVQLIANDESEGEPVTITAADDWTYTWQGLDANADGEPVNYSVEELNVPEEYELGVNDVNHGNIILTNSHTPALTDIPVQKVWDDADDQDRVRPTEIIANLIDHEGELESRVILNDNNDWEHTFTDLPQFANGEEINYTITENSVNDYSTNIEEDEDGIHVITNQYTPEETSVTVVKGWDDANNQDGNRPDSIEVQLTADGEVHGEVVDITVEDEWTYTWDGLALNDEGEPISYSVEELNVPDEYEVNLNDENHGNIILSNSYTPEITEMSGEKIWEDAENQDGIRPESIVVNLLADGVEIDEQEVTSDEDGNWNFSFENLPVYQPGEIGQAITYTITEEEVEAYEVSYDGTTITNSYTPELIDVSGIKIWEDADNQDGVRPDSITVNLLANGEQVASEDASEESDWAFEFTDVPRFENGEEINYTVQEDNVEDYSTEINGTEITNSYTPGETSVNIVKAWEDENNQGARPEAITVNLFADGEAFDSTELTAENNWQADFTELDEYADGEEIEYTITEEETENFLTESVEGSAEDGFVITNRPAKVSVGDYVWLDENENGLQDETDIPLEGVVLVLRDEEGNLVTEDVYGNPIEPQVTDSEGHYSFDDLPINKSYTVEIDREASADALRGFMPTLEEEGDDNGIDSSTWTADSVYLDEDEQRDPTLDFGFVRKRVSVGDYVWIDENRNGLQDETDTPLEGVVLILKDEEGNVVTEDVDGNPVEPQVTDENGHYSFDNLPADRTYTVEVDREAFENDFPALTPTKENVGDRETDSSTWTEDSVFLEEDGQRDPTLDFGFERKRVSVGDYVWFDENKDGLQDDGEPGIPGVVLIITDEDGEPVTDIYGNPVGPTTTDENGKYSFDNLPIDNKYTVSIDREASQESLEGYTPTIENAGDRAIDSSTWVAISEFLDTHDQRDPTLDFGFVLVTPDPVEPTSPEEPFEEDSQEPTEPEEPTEEGSEDSDSEGEDDETGVLPQTGVEDSQLLWFALGTLLIVGGFIVIKQQKKES